VFGPSVASRKGSEHCVAGQVWHWDEVRFEILYPPDSVPRTRRNDSSCVLRIVGAGGSAILFGDVGRAAEEWLLRSDRNLSAEIAVVPHHGSRTSSSAGIVAKTEASYALVSAGFGNQWGFPKDDVVARWRDAGAVPLQTAHEGAMEFLVSRAGVSDPRSFRKVERRYWRN
jgi:competence protein ComEC